MGQNDLENSFYAALENGASGSFNHLDWTLTIRNSELIGDPLVSIHEHFHDHFNQTTSYGWVLIAFSYLSRETQENSFARTLDYLVRRCRITHEIGATFNSVASLATTHAIEPESALSQNPTYLSYYKQGASLTIGLPSLTLKKIAVFCIVTSCLQAPLIAESASKSLDDFDPHEFEGIQFPDERLRIVANHLTRDFWKRLYLEFTEMHQGNTVFERLVSDIPPSEDQDESYKEIEFSFNEIVDREIAKIFRNEGLLSADFNSTHHFLERLIDKALIRHPSKNATKPIRLNTNFEAPLLNLLRSMEQEKLLFEDRHIEPEFTALRDVPITEWKSLTIGAGKSERFCIISRAPERMPWLEYLTSANHELATQIGVDPITCLYQRTTDKNGSEKVKYYWIETPNQLGLFSKLTKGVPIYANTSMLLFSMESWDTIWQPALKKFSLHHSILFDLLPSSQLIEMPEQFDEFCFHKIQLEFEGETRIAMVFIGRIDQDSYPFVAPCSEIVANALINFMRVNCECSTEDKFLLNESKNEIRLALYDLFASESRFDFVALNTQLGRTITKNEFE